MTNVILLNDSNGKIDPTTANTTGATSGFVPFKKKGCIKINLNTTNSAIEISKVADNTLSGADKEACDSIAAAPGVKALIDSKYYTKKADGSDEEQSGIRVGGSSAIDFGNAN